MNRIEIDKLLQKIEKEKINIIDIRSNYEYNIGRIPSAINIPNIILKSNPKKYLQKDKIYYLYCNSGHTSNNLSLYLNNLGYHTVNIEGGYNNYLFH